MKKFLLLVLVLAVLALVGFSVFVPPPELNEQTISAFPIPEYKPQVAPQATPQVTPVDPSTPPGKIATDGFLKGYWDGWHGRWLGPIRWVISDDYRQGHMLGAYDRKHDIQRYPAPAKEKGQD